MRVLDLGCGSGILAIAAKRLGAGYVAAVDIDEVALETTRQNIALNGLSNGDVAVLHASEPMFEDFDLVVANILAQPLKLMAPLIWSRTRPQGAFLIAGLLSRQVDEVLSVYASEAPAEAEPPRVLARLDDWALCGNPLSAHYPPFDRNPSS
jgi:ribosomal protein L11 methyltransferase